MSGNEAPQMAEPDPPQAAATHWLLRFGHRIYTHNPFYLLSVAFVLHSTRLWLNTHTWPYDPWPLMGIVGGYILLVAVVGCLVIHLARAWDNARSILFILLLLFVELSLTFDPVLVPQPRLGLILLVIGWSLAVAVSEGLFWVLPIRLPFLFRGPYHLLLALLFLYPPLIVAGLRAETVSAIWRNLGLFAGVRRGVVDAAARPPPRSRLRARQRHAVELALVSVALVRFSRPVSGGEVLCVDPVVRFGVDARISRGDAAPERLRAFFLVPLVLACGVLLLEAGFIAESSRPAAGTVGPDFGLRVILLPFASVDSGRRFSQAFYRYARRRSGWRCGRDCFTSATRGSEV